MNQIFKNNQYKILEKFIELPTKEFSIRGIARELKISHATVLNHIKKLQKLNFIIKKEETLYPTFYANTENSQFKFYKKNYLVFKLIKSGLIEFIQKETLAFSIVLFGSGAKGTFNSKSDIDVFVESKQKNLNLSKYEKKLKHKINMLFETNINQLSKELRNNIINGVILSGFIKIEAKQKCQK
ncbi:HTH domain-containing protein [Candidatus Woesearchaeota archaeon]|mgnify:CR=1 FL=1|jgi:predicted nucleotidyltransferase|nr:HTH domain-containing protein [Candidatus Woesearchaeota archaeon]